MAQFMSNYSLLDAKHLQVISYFHSMAAAHLIIQGKVQGVFFRVSAKKQADLIGIIGWVQNTKEGHVEVMAQGTEEQVKQFVEWCKRGPSRARVDNVLISHATEQPLKEFKILHK